MLFSMLASKGRFTPELAGIFIYMWRDCQYGKQGNTLAKSIAWPPHGCCNGGFGSHLRLLFI